MSEVDIFKRACALVGKSLDAQDTKDMNMDELRREIAKTRLALFDLVDWINKSPTPTTIQKARSWIETYGSRNSTAPGHISIQIEGSAPRAPSPRKKSPRKGWTSAAASLMASAKWRSKIDKRPSMMQGQGMVELSTLESKSSLSSPHHETKSESHADFKLPEDVRNFQPLGERTDVKSSCESLRENQKKYVAVYKSKSKDKEKKLSQLEDVLRKNVKELKTVMLEGIKDQIYEENCDTKLEKVVDAGNKHFLDVYKSVYHTIENTEGVSLEQYKVEVKRAQAVIKSKSAPRQITSDPVDLLKHALITAPLYEKVVKDLLKDMEKNGTIRAEEVKFSCAPVKKLQRVTEKSMLKAKTPGDASKTLDLVRGMVICSDIPVITKMVAALTDLCSNGKIERVRLKDRFNNPSAGGWRDYMDNFMICGDKNKHICELQIVHKVMITARKGLPGHVVYGKVRNAMELSFLYSGGSDANTFSEMFWGSKQHAALARLFIKCNGRQWHSKQKQGWCTSHDLRKWAGVKLDKNGNVIELDISKRKLDGKNGLTVDMLQALTELRVLNLKETSRHLNSNGGVSDDYESLGDEDLKNVAGACPNLREAHFDFCAKITDKGLTALAESCHHLEILELQECDLITDEGIKVVVKNCQNLSQLNIKECDKITNNGLKHMINLKQLRDLNLQDCDQITNDGIANLKGLTKLTLNYCSEINDDGLAMIAKNCPNLEEISLTELQISDKGIRLMCEKCHNLEKISVYQCRNVGDSGVKEMAKHCKNLQKVDLQYCSRISDKAMESLAKECKNITEIKIRNCDRITDAGLLAVVEACEQLARVDCFGCSLITDAAVRKAASIRVKLVFDR